MFTKTYNVQGTLLEFCFEYSELDSSKIKTLIFQNGMERTIELSNGIFLKSIPKNFSLGRQYTFSGFVDNGTKIDEFLGDLELQLDVLKSTTIDGNGIAEMISAAISNHVNKYGRLIFSDIDIYLNVTMNIVVALRKAQNLESLTLEEGLEIKQFFEKQILEVFADYIYISSIPFDPMAIPGMPKMPWLNPTLLKLTEIENRTIYILD